MRARYQCEVERRETVTGRMLDEPSEEGTEKQQKSARDRKDPRSHQGKDPRENQQNRRRAGVKSRDF